MILFEIVLLFIPNSIFANQQVNPLSAKFVDDINSKQKLWTAGHNFHPNTSVSFLLRLLGTQLTEEYSLSTKTYDAEFIESLPENFDSRKIWPGCPTIQEINDQGDCGSCWALSSVEAMSDRICIHSKGAYKWRLSAEELLTCESRYHGCSGGEISHAYEYWNQYGIVTGGPYGSNEGCQPYTVAPCEHYVTGPKPICDERTMSILPPCSRQCVAGYPTPYRDDKKFGQTPYLLASEGDIRAEIYLNGPVTVIIEVYYDFFLYKNGIYQTSVNQSTNLYHAVKIIGWGVENGIKYWIVANSWNTDWGDKGFVKFLRGVNQNLIESYAVAGLPSFDQMYR